MDLPLLSLPALPRLLAGLVMMVGSYRSPGNTGPTLEWNAIVDPEAPSRESVIFVAGEGPEQQPNATIMTSANATSDWILRLFNVPSSTPRFFDLDHPARQRMNRAQPKTDYFTIF